MVGLFGPIIGTGFSRRQNSSTAAIGMFAAGYLMRMLVGFRFPDYEYSGHAESQLHFISESHTAGGHALSWDLQSGRLEMEHMSRFHVGMD